MIVYIDEIGYNDPDDCCGTDVDCGGGCCGGGTGCC